MTSQLTRERLTHLRLLEAESIQIIREVASEFEKPVMLYSIGKDSTVLVRLAIKAFHPMKVPFPLMHIDTTWKFQDMIKFRDAFCKENNLDLLVYTNPQGVAEGINPFDHGSEKYTDIMKTQALKQALTKYQFDAAFGGARRDEEKSRAKERIFSFRDKFHQWDPKNQRPELWNLFNTKINKGESIRVFPLSNWTELDVWQYIYLEQVPVVPLYFDKGTGKRYRSLGCRPCTNPVESTARTVQEIIDELRTGKFSQIAGRSGRAQDAQDDGGLETLRRDGYM